MNRLIVLLSIMVVLTGCAQTSGNCQIVEKGEYSRLQYITSNNTMTPEFVQGYYIVVRNGTTGAENREWVSKEEYDACVVGDTVDNTRERW